MRAIGFGAVLVLFVVLFALLFAWADGAFDRWAAARRARRAKWEPVTFTLPDGTMVVALRKPGNEDRVVKELPPGMDSVDFQAELRIAVEDAELQAVAANKKPTTNRRLMRG